MYMKWNWNSPFFKEMNYHPQILQIFLIAHLLLLQLLLFLSKHFLFGVLQLLHLGHSTGTSHLDVKAHYRVLSFEADLLHCIFPDLE